MIGPPIFTLEVSKNHEFSHFLDHMATNSQSKVGKICGFSLQQFDGSRDMCVF